MILQFLNIFSFSSQGQSATSCFSRNFKQWLFQSAFTSNLLVCLQWSPLWETSRNKLLAQFVSKPSKNQKLYRVFTRSAVSVWKNTQEWAKDMENSDAPSVRQKSTYQKEIASKRCQPVFFTTVCWISLPFDKVAMEQTSLVATVTRPAPMSITALIVLDLCALNVWTHMKLCATHSKDTKSCLLKTSKIKITRLC